MRRLSRAGLPAAIVVALASAQPTSVAAQDAPATMMLSCTGMDVAVERTGTSTTVKVVPGVVPPIGTPQHQAAVAAATATTSTDSTPIYSAVRVPGRISVAIEGGVVKVRPSQQTRPGFTQRRSSDGWYELTDVAITDTRIQGKATWGGMLSGKHKLDIDRRTGDVRFGDFNGVCEKAAESPEARKF